MKRILIAVVLILGLLLMSSPVSAAGITVVDKTGDGWTDDTWEVEIFPGESKSTTISLYNSSSSSLDVEVTILPDSLDGGNLIFELNETDFTMPGKSYIDVTLTVEANGSATPGIYATDLTIRFEVPPSRPSGGGGFGITRYLKVDLWGADFKTRVTSDGEVKVDLEAVSDDGRVTLCITKGVLAQTEDGERLKKIVVIPMEESPPLPENGYIIGIAYDFSPKGATFDPFIELEIRYDSSHIPNDVSEEDLLIAYYDEEYNGWLELECTVDADSDAVAAEVNHLTPFAIVGYEVAVAPTPAAFTIRALDISPIWVDIGQSVTISAVVRNTGGKAGIYEVILSIGGIVEATREVVVSAGASKKVTFTVVGGVAGSWGVDVNGLSGSFMIKPSPPPIEPAPTPPPLPPTLPEEPESEVLWGLVAAIVGIGVAVIALGVIVYWRGRRGKGQREIPRILR